MRYAVQYYNKIGSGYEAVKQTLESGQLLPSWTQRALENETPFSDLELVMIDLNKLTKKVIASGERISKWIALEQIANGVLTGPSQS